MNHITIVDPGKTTFKRGEIISQEALDKENERVSKLGEKTAKGMYFNAEGKSIEATYRPNREQASEKRLLVALTRDELDILYGVVREELGLITEGELKDIILTATKGKSSWEGGLTPLLTVLHPRLR